MKMKMFGFVLVLILLQGRGMMSEPENNELEIREIFREYFGVLNEEIQSIKQNFESEFALLRAHSEVMLNKMMDMMVSSKLQDQAQQDLKRNIKTMTETYVNNTQLNENMLMEILKRLDDISLITNETSSGNDTQVICNTDFNLKEVDFKTIEGKADGTSSYGSCCKPEGAFIGVEWHSGEPTLPQAIWYQFESPIKVVIYSFKSRPPNEENLDEDGPSKYEFFGSNSTDCSDQSSWRILAQDNSGTPFSPDYAIRTEHVTHPDLYTCYGFKVNEVPGRWDGKKWVIITNVRFIIEKN